MIFLETGGIDLALHNSGLMKHILACLLAGLILTGCIGGSMQPVALAYQDISAPTAEQPQQPSYTPQTQAANSQIPDISTPTSIPTPKPTPTPEPYSYAYGPYFFPSDINPLTGLPVEDQALLERRPIVVKVTNFPRSVRPQSGLSLADQVFEYYIGDSMSRFIGVFYSKDASQVGPIRSARLFDEHVMRMYNGIFIFGWADDPILEFLLAPDIKSHLVVERPDNCPPLCRTGPNGAYNNLFVDTSMIGAYLSDRGTNNDRQKLSGLRYDVAVPKSGNTGEQIYIEYSGVSYHYWQYDPENSRYWRFQEADDALGGAEKQYTPLIDNLTGSQLNADNVVVLLVPHVHFLKSNSTEIFDQTLDGQGQGYAFRNGYVYPITWSHDAPDQLIKMTLPTGAVYSLKPGTVWFEVIGETSEFEPLDQGAYSFTFDVP